MKMPYGFNIDPAFRPYLGVLQGKTLTIPDQTPELKKNIVLSYPAIDGKTHFGSPYHFPEQEFTERELGDAGLSYGFSIKELQEKANADCRPLQPTDNVKAYPAEFFGDFRAIEKFSKIMTYEEVLKSQTKRWLLEPFSSN